MAWRSIADFIGLVGEVALVGAPMEAGSVTPGRCDLGPETVRRALKRFSTYDPSDALEIELAVADYGDVPVQGLSPAEGFLPIREAVGRATRAHALTMLVGGNNAITRPAVHGLGLPLSQVGLITLDAHFDMRETDGGPMNGNPVRCLIEDGLPGRNICQIGLAPFANTAKMHFDAVTARAKVITIDDLLSWGVGGAVNAALAHLDHVEAIVVDFDIDVIDRGQMPAAPGARPGGMPVRMFFEAARMLGRCGKVRLVDLTEFDPSLDVSDIGALTAGRWVCEVLAGYVTRDPSLRA